MVASGLQRRRIELLLDKVDYLPTLPGVALHLLPRVTAEHLSRREIQMAVEVDATLCARAVKLAIDLGHSPDSITSIEAVFDAVPLDALAANLMSVETVEQDVVEEVRLVRLWRHVLAAGMAAQVIATRLGTLPPETALLASLLHDIGQIALPILMPKAYAQVLERVDSSGGDLLAAERELLGVDHAVMGKRLAQRWGFTQAFQSVIWLHHQAQMPVAELASPGPLTQVVRLADLLVRQEGFSYHPSEQVCDSPAEVAERLGLSGAHAEQIGRQVTAAFQQNAGPMGIDDTPPADELRRCLGRATAHLGRVYRYEYMRAHKATVEAQRAGLLIRLNAGLANCHAAREVLETVATTALEALRLRLAIPYVRARDGSYIEGIRCTPQGGVEEHFLYDVSDNSGLEPPPSEERASFAAPGAPIRAERVEGWLFERQGPLLGSGPFYTVAMTVEDANVGGFFFAFADPAHELTSQEASELVALASLTGIALKRAQAEADLVVLSEELAQVNRELRAADHERLQQRNAASLGEMAAGAAHEINNPLAIISGRAQQLAGDEKDPARHDILGTIVAQAARISDIIMELRLFARPPAPEARAVDAVDLARRVVGEFEEAAGRAGVRVAADLPQESPLIHVDPAQVSGAIGEVVRNAVEACARAAGGTVTLTVQYVAADAAVRFIVTDDGPGME
ncbi:MAG: HDOD domain-containing protein, partial [Acidobacteria bacterium]|nr:HDOD domain-containing protein [Acidobacteriota bacterium]